MYYLWFVRPGGETFVESHKMPSLTKKNENQCPIWNGFHYKYKFMIKAKRVAKSRNSFLFSIQPNHKYLLENLNLFSILILIKISLPVYLTFCEFQFSFLLKFFQSKFWFGIYGDCMFLDWFFCQFGSLHEWWNSMKINNEKFTNIELRKWAIIFRDFKSQFNPMYVNFPSFAMYYLRYLHNCSIVTLTHSMKMFWDVM
jgi:hypothetical protein